ncbi:MAG: DUF5702 domain-containing protein [Anaerovoracaceae bacterium]|nr:DUF5702 domain-containing protein [Anaerovoracaceae bacterium]
MMIMAAMLILVLAIVAATEKTASARASDALFSMAGRSVLSEYDRALQKEYGLFAVRAFDPEIEKKIRFYVDQTYGKMKFFRLDKVEADTTGCCLQDTEVFKKEVKDCVKYESARGLVKKLTGVEGSGNPVSSGTGIIGSDGASRDFVLRNSAVINELPSKGMTGGRGIIDKIKETGPDGGNVFRAGTDRYMINQYIMRHFKNAQDSGSGGDTFFNYEAEYILEGKMSDEDNRRAFLRQLKILRNGINILYIESRPDMLAEVTALAASMTPGPEAALTEVALIELWALAEAENDVEILMHGGKVPIAKTPATWATDLKAAVDGKAGYIDTHSPTGLTYQGYLQAFLFFEGEEVKLARMMDLIQINLKGSYDRDFLIKECCTGFKLRAKVNGRTYIYAHRY